MVSMQDYMDFGQGMGIASAADVAELNKALNTGAYAQANGVAGQTMVRHFRWRALKTV